jgi:hypothetical protein
MAALRLGLTGRWWAEIAGSRPRQSLAQVAGFMSGSGHERCFCDVCGTSALPPILTVTADILNRQLRANRRHMQRSKLQSIRSPRQRGEQRWRHFEAERRPQVEGLNHGIRDEIAANLSYSSAAIENQQLRPTAPNRGHQT